MTSVNERNLITLIELNVLELSSLLSKQFHIVLYRLELENNI